ncbi:hypothetical protein KA005_69080 [bacterium]|nr:hypothetical protein [bacterium]
MGIDNGKIILASTPNRDKSRFYAGFVDRMPLMPIWTSVDWAEGSGNNRGDITKRESNVVHVRFSDKGL